MADVPPPTPLPYAAPPLAEPVPVAPAMPYADVPVQLSAARDGWRPIGRAVRYATFDAWTLTVFAALSLPCTAGGVVGIVLAAVLAWCAAAEFRAAGQLRRLDPDAPRRLAINQLILAAAVVVYSGWNLVLVATGGGMLAELNAHQSELGDLGPQAADLTREVLYALYVLLAIVGGAVPAATAWFYAGRTPLLRAYLGATPPWILQMQRDRGQL